MQPAYITSARSARPVSDVGLCVINKDGGSEFLVERAQEFQDLFLSLPIERSGRFVGNHQMELTNQGLRNSNAAKLSPA